MGALFSCCCRRRKRDPEREPLLPEHESRLPVIPTQASLNKVADVLAALHTGKLPSQQQLSGAIRILLNSSFFRNIDERGASSLSERGRVVLRDIEEFLQAFQELGDGKNGSNSIQETIYNLGRVGSRPVSIQPTVKADAIPTATETLAETSIPAPDFPPVEEVREDARLTTDSLRVLISLLFTSPAFRIVLQDIFVTLREILADIVRDVKATAELVETKAAVLEETLRPSDSEQVAGATPPTLDESGLHDLHVQQEAEIRKVIDKTANRGSAAWEALKQQSPDRIRRSALERIKSIAVEAQADPRFEDALQTLLALSEKYFRPLLQAISVILNAATTQLEVAMEASRTVNVSVETQADPNLVAALRNLKEIFEEFAGGRLGTASHDLHVVVKDLVHALPDSDGGNALDLLQRLRRWFVHGLSEPSWLSTADADAELGDLYDEARSALQTEISQNEALRHDLDDVGQDMGAILDTISDDPSVKRLGNAWSKLQLDTSYVYATSGPTLDAFAHQQARRTAREVKAEIIRDIVSVLVPRVLQVMSVIPLPRIEVKHPAVNAVLENLSISSLSFLPDRITITNSNQLDIVGSDLARQRRSYGATPSKLPSPVVTLSEGRTRTRIEVKGLRLSADEIAYYAELKGPLGTGWTDSGLLSVDIGDQGATGEGLSATIDLETSAGDVDLPTPSSVSFKVIDVVVDVPGLTFQITKSRHWIFNTLVLQPLLGPVLRRVLGSLIASQLRKALENVGDRLNDAGADSVAKDGSVDVMGLAWRFLFPPQTSDESEESEEEADAAVSSSEITAKGIVHATRVETSPEHDTVIAVGVGQQVLDVPLPSPEGRSLTLEDVQREALEEMEAGRQKVLKKASEVRTSINTARQTARRELETAAGEFLERSEIERRMPGWYSEAFNNA